MVIITQRFPTKKRNEMIGDEPGRDEITGRSDSRRSDQSFGPDPGHRKTIWASRGIPRIHWSVYRSFSCAQMQAMTFRTSRILSRRRGGTYGSFTFSPSLNDRIPYRYFSSGSSDQRPLAVSVQFFILFQFFPWIVFRRLEASTCPSRYRMGGNPL